MTVFDEDLTSAPVRSVLTDQSDWVADVSARLRDYLEARSLAPRFVEPSVVELAGALLAVFPLADAASAIALSMAMPSQPDEYDPLPRELASFADTVNRARRDVYRFSEDCWAARRALLVDWSHRAKGGGLDPSEGEAGLTECSVVVAEAAVAEQRLALFEKGLARAIAVAEDAQGRDDVETVAGVIAEVKAAGQRHSMPPAVAIDCV